VICTDFPVATSARKMCVAASKFARYAMLFPSGDHVALLTSAPLGA
jgi:hypothetical protein